MVADYRYYFGALRAEGVIAEIPMYGTYMDMELNKGGQFTGSFQLDMYPQGPDNLTLINATQPGFNYVMVERNGIVIWGGFIWSRTYNSNSKDVQIYARSFEQYPQTQVVDEDYDSTVTDQLNIFCDLWNTMQAGDGRNLGINVPAIDFSGTSVDRWVTSLATDVNLFGELMDQIANTDNGFDWFIFCRRVPGTGTFQRDLMLGWPIIGNTSLSQGATVFDYPGNITSYYCIENMQEAGNNVFLTGSGDGSSMIFATDSNDNQIDVLGWPRWDQVVPEKDVSNPTRLADLATQEINNRLPPMQTLKITVKADSEDSDANDFLSWGYLGDQVQIDIVDPRFPDGLEVQPRIAKWTLNPPLSTQVEEYSIFVVGDIEDL